MELATLTDDIHGDVYRPGDPGYDQARMAANWMIVRRPAVIVRPVDEDGVAAVVNLAREQRGPLAVLCGGHGVSGHGTCADGIVVDLSGVKHFDVFVPVKIAHA